MQNPSKPLESSASEVIDSLGKSSRHCIRNCEEKIRTSPIRAVLGAAAVGYLFRFVPLGLLVGGIVRLLLLLAKPVIVSFGAVKLYEFFRQNAARKPQFPVEQE